jgi:uncharacterized RDD family membrane protein YckC
MTTSSPATSRTDTTPQAAVDAPASAPNTAVRAIARGVDMFTVLFLTLAVVLLGLAPAMDAISDRLAPGPWGRALAATVLYSIVASVYEVAFLVTRGQTPGKDLLNLRVVDAATGEPPGWSGAIRRTLPFAALRLVPGPILGTVIVVVLGASVPFDRRGRALHDVLAGTVVVRHDADAEQHDLPRLDRAELSKVYGPRSVWEQLVRRARPE